MIKIIRLFIVLRLVLLFSLFLGEKFIPLRAGTYLGEGLREPIPSLLSSRANFDGAQYALIAQNGYGYLQQSFFPLYPKLISLVQNIFPSAIISGLLISNFFFLGAIFLFWKLLREEKVKKETVEKSLLFFILFPTAFYFVSLYTESLFLFLVFLAFYLAKKGKFFWAGVVAGFASYTRFAGIFLFPALLVEYYEFASRRKMKDRLAALANRFAHIRQNHFLQSLLARWPHFKNLFFISLSSGGLLVYMAYLKSCCGNPFYFAQIQANFGGGGSMGKLILLYQVFWRYLKMIFTVYPRQWLYFNVWFEFLISLLFLGLLLWGWYKRKEYKIRSSWLVFATASYLLPTLTGTLSSMPRYVLACFPAFVVFAKLLQAASRKKRYNWPMWLALATSLILLIISSALFFRGYWVA